MLDSISRIAPFSHDADAASRQRSEETRVAKTIELASKGEAAVREEPNGEDRLLKSCCIVIVLGESLSAVVVDVHSYAVDESFRNHTCLFHLLDETVSDPTRWLRHVASNTSSHRTEVLTQLRPGPHVPIAKEELGSREALAHKRLLSSVGKIGLVTAERLGVASIVLKANQFIMRKEVLVTDDSSRIVQRVAFLALVLSHLTPQVLRLELLVVLGQIPRVEVIGLLEIGSVAITHLL